MARTNDLINFMLSGVAVEANANMLCLNNIAKYASYLIINSIYLGAMTLLTVSDVIFRTTLWKYKLLITVVAWAVYSLIIFSTFWRYCYDTLRNSEAYLRKGPIKIVTPSASLLESISSVWSMGVVTNAMTLTTLDCKIEKARSVATKLMTCIYTLYIIEAIVSIYVSSVGVK